LTDRPYDEGEQDGARCNDDHERPDREAESALTGRFNHECPRIASGDEIKVNPSAESPPCCKVMKNAASEQEPQCPEAQPCCDQETAYGQRHRGLSLVHLDLPAQGETEGMQQGDESEDGPRDEQERLLVRHRIFSSPRVGSGWG
jgi:hypothetical protein